MKMSGDMRTMFGVCANEWATDDGAVVSLDHTCGSHSETDVPKNGTAFAHLSLPHAVDGVLAEDSVGRFYDPRQMQALLRKCRIDVPCRHIPFIQISSIQRLHRSV